MNKRGIIIMLYSVALLAVLAVILLATVQPKTFVVEVGQTHAEIVRLTETAQNYNSYMTDAAEVAYIRSTQNLSDHDQFKFQFETEFNKIMNNYPIFDDSEAGSTFETTVVLMYEYTFGETEVTIKGVPIYKLDSPVDYYIDENNELIFVREDVIDSYYISSGNFEAKIYPNFQISKPIISSESPDEDAE